MNSDRIREIQEETAYPDSVSVKTALLQVWNECQQESNSFARSQAIEFEEWYWSENCPYYWMGGTYSHGETNEVVSTSELYSLFLSHQAKQSNPETK